MLQFLGAYRVLNPREPNVIETSTSAIMVRHVHFQSCRDPLQQRCKNPSSVSARLSLDGLTLQENGQVCAASSLNAISLLHSKKECTTAWRRFLHARR